MYTMVLMMAMTGSGEAPNFGGKLFGGCRGNSCVGVVAAAPAGCTGYAAPAGCTGVVVATPVGCTGTPAGCTGNSCQGGGFLGLRGKLFGGFLGGRGCTGTPAGCTGYVPAPVCPTPCAPVACPTPCPAPCTAACAPVSTGCIGTVVTGCPTVAMPAPVVVPAAPAAMPTPPAATEGKPVEKKAEPATTEKKKV